ncbi:GNAT family N-acetyltransferase [Cellulophaga sp. HaHa_2_1]|uniref:GNAT family N-acetyltransferase n=1 Tax=Cellulophaga sp. HaHa_2_1 TaxID=2749994 RepID=UPI001C4F3762|nr:GNAT family N-acetyltransferase [Cellulophaga sp. HaHa_2_1]QXP52690.1 GNAT family N-acetyltransferase [Cellulophaga sp. HaHa_2_1]
MKTKAITLENDIVKLTPLSLENCEYLCSIAEQPKLVQYSPSAIETPVDLENYVKIALAQQEAETSIPFIVYDKRISSYAGSTRFMNINWKNKILEIGATWIGREFHGSGLNTQMKALMLQYAFTELQMEKVEFRIDERNTASRKAVEKLGCVLEGVLRKNVYLLDGFKRNTCCYGLLKEEWIENNFKNSPLKTIGK